MEPPVLQNIDLRELAEMQGNGRDFVSVYFSGKEGIDSLKARERALRALLEDNPTEAELFEENLRLIREVLEENPTDEAEGVCLFACALLDFVRGYPITMPVPSEMHVGPTPYLRPLAELQDEYDTFAVVACDNSSTRIFLVINHTAEVEEAVRGGVKNHVRKGGWSQQRYSRRRDNQLQRYARDVVEALEQIVTRHEIERIVMVGSAETMNEIEDELPPPLAERLVGKETLNLQEGEDEIVALAYADYFAEERDVEEELWQRIKNQYMKHGRAAVGATDVLKAGLEGRVEAMIVTRDVQIPGTQCRACETLVHGTPQTCQSCGSKSVFEVDLVDALARQMELTSATVNFADPIPGLTKVGDVAALLRF